MTIPTYIGKYEIERRLGGGGMAEVYRAHLVGAERFSRYVAIKRILPSFAGDETFSALFVREAHLCARLHHANIVSVLDFARDPEHGLFLAMELVEGRDLHQLASTGLLPVPLVIHLAIEILQGLAYAHDLPATGDEVCGIVHRDVSPHNVLLSWDGAVKLSDFGIAKARTAADASASIMIKGKPAYMSPEQINGRPLDGRSDLFAVGVMLWELLVGYAPFQGSTAEEVLTSVFFAAVPPPRKLRPTLAKDLSNVVMCLLQRDRERRYASAHDAIRALLACRDASSDGRSALVETLSARFPDEAPQRRTPPLSLPCAQPSPAAARWHKHMSQAHKHRRLAGSMVVGAVTALLVLLVTPNSGDRAEGTVSPPAPTPERVRSSPQPVTTQSTSAVLFDRTCKTVNDAVPPIAVAPPRPTPSRRRPGQRRTFSMERGMVEIRITHP
ncbi:MAG: serine/threonine-protein kinase [Kofleriaceae bacterium]